MKSLLNLGKVSVRTTGIAPFVPEPLKDGNATVIPGAFCVVPQQPPANPIAYRCFNQGNLTCTSYNVGFGAGVPNALCK